MSKKMKCPKCGAEMNHHGDKLVYGGENGSAANVLGGAIEEFHSCPKCGRNASRPAD